MKTYIQGRELELHILYLKAELEHPQVFPTPLIFAQLWETNVVVVCGPAPVISLQLLFVWLVAVAKSPKEAQSFVGPKVVEVSRQSCSKLESHIFLTSFSVHLIFVKNWSLLLQGKEAGQILIEHGPISSWQDNWVNDGRRMFRRSCQDPAIVYLLPVTHPTTTANFTKSGYTQWALHMTVSPHHSN